MRADVDLFFFNLNIFSFLSDFSDNLGLLLFVLLLLARHGCDEWIEGMLLVKGASRYWFSLAKVRAFVSSISRKKRPPAETCRKFEKLAQVSASRLVWAVSALLRVLSHWLQVFIIPNKPLNLTTVASRL